MIKLPEKLLRKSVLVVGMVSMATLAVSCAPAPPPPPPPPPMAQTPPPPPPPMPRPVRPGSPIGPQYG